MNRPSVVKNVFWLLLWVGLAVAAGYWLRRLDFHFEWLMVVSVVIWIWLGTTLVCLLLSFLVEDD